MVTERVHHLLKRIADGYSWIPLTCCRTTRLTRCLNPWGHILPHCTPRTGNSTSRVEWRQGWVILTTLIS